MTNNKDLLLWNDRSKYRYNGVDDCTVRLVVLDDGGSVRLAVTLLLLFNVLLLVIAVVVAICLNFLLFPNGLTVERPLDRSV